MQQTVQPALSGAQSGATAVVGELPDAQTGFGIDGDETQKHLDFTSVRGSFDNNPFVLSVRNHIEVKGALGDKMLTRLQAII